MQQDPKAQRKACAKKWLLTGVVIFGVSTFMPSMVSTILKMVAMCFFIRAAVHIAPSVKREL